MQRADEMPDMITIRSMGARRETERERSKRRERLEEGRWRRRGEGAEKE